MEASSTLGRLQNCGKACPAPPVHERPYKILKEDKMYRTKKLACPSAAGIAFAGARSKGSGATRLCCAGPLMQEGTFLVNGVTPSCDCRARGSVSQFK